jgi:hypothetical protein
MSSSEVYAMIYPQMVSSSAWMVAGEAETVPMAIIDKYAPVSICGIRILLSAKQSISTGATVASAIPIERRGFTMAKQVIPPPLANGSMD